MTTWWGSTPRPPRRPGTTYSLTRARTGEEHLFFHEFLTSCSDGFAHFCYREGGGWSTRRPVTHSQVKCFLKFSIEKLKRAFYSLSWDLWWILQPEEKMDALDHAEYTGSPSKLEASDSSEWRHLFPLHFLPGNSRNSPLNLMVSSLKISALCMHV